MNEPKVTFFDEIPEDHMCDICGEELGVCQVRHSDGWNIAIYKCSACDELYVKLDYKYNPEKRETVAKMQELLHEINSAYPSVQEIGERADEPDCRYREAGEGELAECPFCHKHEKNLRVEWSGLVYRVICDANAGGCGASTGWEWSMAEAVAKWNNRRVPADVDTVIQSRLSEQEIRLKKELASTILNNYYLIRRKDIPEDVKSLIEDFIEKDIQEEQS